MQVLNADAIVVKLNSGEYKTIHLSSIRPPRLEGEVRVNACPSLDTPSLRPLRNPQGAACHICCLQSADVKVFLSHLSLLRGLISSLHASFTLSLQRATFGEHQGGPESQNHVGIWHASAALQPKAL